MNRIATPKSRTAELHTAVRQRILNTIRYDTIQYYRRV